MRKPLISIIVPVYKAEKYLSECLDSILYQNYTYWECILVDDGSPDSSGLICDEYVAKDSRFRVIHKNNRGVSSARNIGIENAKGNIVTFVDSDDWINPNYCEVISKEMEDDIDLLFFQADHVYSEGVVVSNIPRCGTFSEKKSIEKELNHLLINQSRYQFFGYTWNKAFKKDMIKLFNIQFAVGLSLKEDEAFTLRYALEINKLKVIPNKLYKYRIVETGLTKRKKRAKDFLDLFAEEEKIIHQFRESSFLHCLKTQNFMYLYSAFFLEMNLINAIKNIRKIREYSHKNMISSQSFKFRIIETKPAPISYLLGTIYHLYLVSKIKIRKFLCRNMII